MAHSSNFPVVTLVSSALIPVLADPYPTDSQEPVGVVFGRSARDWHEGVQAYCDRQIQKLPRGERRFSAEAVHFNEIAYTMHSRRYADPENERIHVVLPPLEHEKAPALLPRELEYRGWNRRDLAQHIIDESSDPAVNDVRMLSHVSKEKLARRLAGIRLANVTAAREAVRA